MAFVVAAIAMVAVEAWWFAHDGAIEVEVRRIPTEERRALYDRSMQTLRSICERPTGPRIEEFCDDQVEIVRAFPECDAACRGYLGARFGTRPTR